MIVNFTVGNFLSFKDKRTLSFEASSIKDHPENIIKHRGKRLLRTLVIYGANSSGKSNLLKAMGSMQDVLIDSVKLNPNEPLKYSPFLLSTETDGQPTFFEIEFFIENILYRYGYEYNEKEITKEWLFRNTTLKGEEDFLFLRIGQDISINKSFDEGKGKEKATNSNRLFLSLVAQLGGEISQKILEWFKNELTFISGIDHQDYEKGSSIIIQLIEDINDAFFKPLNLGFKKIISDDSVSSDLSFDEKLDFLVDKKNIDPLRTTHNIFNNNGEIIDEISFDYTKSESEGTKKIIHLSYPITAALSSGKSLVIDEFDAKLHPILTQKLISLFQNKVSNKNPQLLFATHDTNLLDSGLFRRDQIWFTEKDDIEQTDLYSLYDLKLPDGSKVRNDANIEKNYIKGRYGAIPYINNGK